MLVGFRVVQAAGAALLTPTSLGLILATTEPERRHSAVRAWAAVGGIAAALGPVVGGLLVAASWRWVFLVNLPVGLLALAVGWRRLPRVPGHPVSPPDALGALLITAALGAMVLAHRERFERRKTQRELSAERFQPGGHPTTLPNPGVFAHHNAVDVAALLPDGSPALRSVSAALRPRTVAAATNTRPSGASQLQLVPPLPDVGAANWVDDWVDTPARKESR